jgi:hypothetical protein
MSTAPPRGMGAGTSAGLDEQRRPAQLMSLDDQLAELWTAGATLPRSSNRPALSRGVAIGWIPGASLNRQAARLAHPRERFTSRQIGTVVRVTAPLGANG